MNVLKSFKKRSVTLEEFESAAQALCEANDFNMQAQLTVAQLLRDHRILEYVVRRLLAARELCTSPRAVEEIEDIIKEIYGKAN